MIQIDELERKLSRVKMQMMGNKKCSFVTAIILQLQTELVENHPVWAGQKPTAATDTIRLLFAISFLAEISEGETAFTLAHEALHCALDHCMIDRRGDRCPDLWGRAADHYINPRIVHHMGLPKPDGALYNIKYLDDKWTTELIYDDLVKSQQGKPQQQPHMNDLIMVDPRSDKNGDGQPAGGNAGASNREKMNRILAQAGLMEKQIHGGWGHLPGDIQIFLENLFNPKIPWDQLYRNYMDTYAKQDYSRKKPNKRMLPDFFMPTLYSEKVGKLAFMVDSSGSVSDKDFKHFISEMQYAKTLLEPEETTVVSFDTRIQDIIKLGEYETFHKVKFHGRGGTNIHPAIEYFKQQANRPDVLTIFSDLECKALEEDPGFPIIWIRIGKHGFKPKFGKVIQYDPD